MLSVGFGHDVHYLTASVTSGREGYYTSATDAGGEPPGQWYGTGAAELGLVGEADTATVEMVYHRLQDPRDSSSTLGAPHKKFRSAEELHRQLLEEEGPSTPERRQELWVEAQSRSRQAVAFTDVTLNAPKSISVLGVALERAAVEAERRGEVKAAQAWRTHHRAVEESAMVGARAALDYLEEVAGYGRVGKHGAGADRWQDSHRWVASMWLQHDTREHDPHLHVHMAILNKQLCADGKWRGLDNMAIKLHRAAASAISERAMEEYLSATLGVRFETRPDGKAREIVGVDKDVMDLFSSRRRAIGPKTQELVDAFRAKYGREPTNLQRSHMAQQATLATRQAKSHQGESTDARLERWERETQARLGASLSKVAEDTLARRQDSGPVADWLPRDVIKRALAQIADRGDSTWTRSDLMRAVSDALPGHLGVAPEQVRPILESLTDAALEQAVRITPESDLSIRPAEYLLADGSDVFRRPGSARFAVPGQLQANLAMRAAAVVRGAEKVTDAQVSWLLERYAEHGVELGVDQTAAVRGILTSGAQMEVLVGPAGTGKTVVLGAVAEMWREHGRSVLGLAPSQVAADVMADEGINAVNIDRWLRSGAAGVGAGDIVIVDEAGMASTQQLRAVHEHCQAAGAKMLLTGDPRQLGAVGPGGAMEDVAERAESYELVEVRRFKAEWERTASLGLRDGDPSALDAYEKAGRIRSGGTEDQAEAQALRAWLADTLTGRESLLLVGGNDQAARVSAAARAELVRLGRVPEEGVQLGRDGNTASVGDVVQARRNGWHIAGTPINRATYRVTETREDGSLTVAPVIGGTLGPPVNLPPSYVAEHVTLAYASTVHAAQGRTVGTTHSVISGGWGTAQAYVGLTRGRDSNTAWMVTTPTSQDSPAGEAQQVESRTGRAVLADVVEKDQRERSALAELELQELEARSEFTVAGQLILGISQSCAGTTSALLDRLEADGTITGGQRVALAGDEAMGAVERLLRAAELDGQDRGELLAEALGGRSLATARDPGRVLHHRLHHHLQVDSTVSSFRDLIPATAREDHRPWLDERAESADARRAELGAQTAAEAPEWAVTTLGPVPDDALERLEWEEKAGWAAAYREIAQHEDATDPLGPAPPAGLAEKHAIWRTAHSMLGMTDRGPDEGAMSEGQLRVRVAAYEREKVWAPVPVQSQLAATATAAEERRVDGVLYGEADAPDVAAVVAEAESLAERAAALAEADAVRQRWADEVAKTREEATRARAELLARAVDLDAPEERVTAEEWAAAHRATVEAEDEHRPVDQVAEVEPEYDREPAGLETAVPDVRDIATPHPAEDSDAPRGVAASMSEVAEAVARAQEALVEMRNRESLVEPDEWAVEDTATDGQEDVDEMTLEAAL
jgi:conjugative relaxase-like TrwC/TraI family protein